jgi:NAD-dependent DNA ligase
VKGKGKGKGKKEGVEVEGGVESGVEAGTKSGVEGGVEGGVEEAGPGGVDAGETAGTEAGAGAGGLPLLGETVVFTGRLAGMTRPQAEDTVRALGGKVKKSVSAGVTILVADSEGDRESSKLKAARDKGVKIWDEAAWMGFLEGQAPSL